MSCHTDDDDDITCLLQAAEKVSVIDAIACNAIGGFKVHMMADIACIATGGTIVSVLDDIIARGADPSQIVVVCIVAAPPALKKLSEKYLGEHSGPSQYCAFKQVTCPHANLCTLLLALFLQSRLNPVGDSTVASQWMFCIL